MNEQLTLEGELFTVSSKGAWFAIVKVTLDRPSRIAKPASAAPLFSGILFDGRFAIFMFFLWFCDLAHLSMSYKHIRVSISFRLIRQTKFRTSNPPAQPQVISHLSYFLGNFDLVRLFTFFTLLL